MTNTSPPSANTKIPRTVWVLGYVSLFMDISSEIVHGLLPVFLVSILGASYTSVGLIEGLGEGTALFFKFLSGPLSDRWKKRKTLVFIGYAMGGLSKPLFAIAQSSSIVLGARLFDRMGKGIRGAPRDALMTDVTPEAIRGKAFGLRQSMDTVGAFVGPLLAIVLMKLLHDNFRMIFWLAGIPAAISLALIAFGIREPDNKSAAKKNISLQDFKKFKKAFWLVCLCGALLQMARFSEAFLILRVKDFGLSFSWMPLVLVTMNIVYALVAYPAGILSDRMGRKKIIFLGVLILIAADVMMGFGNNLPWMFAGIMVWGLHLGLTQGVLTAMVADTCPPEYRATAFGIFSLLSAIALIFGSPLAGFLWDHFGPTATFMTGAAVAILGLVLLVFE